MTNVGIISFGTSKVRTCKHNMPRALEIVTAELSTTIQNPALKSLKRSYHHYHNTSGEQNFQGGDINEELPIIKLHKP